MDTQAQHISKEVWSEELEQSSKRYHIVGAWVAIIFNPIFGFTDYLNIVDWQRILIIRFSISAITLAVLLMKKKFNIPSYIIVFVPFLLISLQNAYTYSLIEVDAFMGHSLNYIALWIGAGMFILWHWKYSVTVISISLGANIIFFNLNHNLDFGEGMVNGGLLLVVVALFMMMLIHTRYNLTIKTIQAKLALEMSNQALYEQKEITEKKNKDIMGSIRYAQRIQNATLPQLDKIKETLPQSFVLFKPRDVVSGDFYWFWHKDNYTVIAAVDCTGHGVPGAFMSMKGDAILNQILNVEQILEPHLILAEIHKEIQSGLKQKESKNRDGMDAALCLIDFQQKELHFSGANTPLVYIQNEKLKVIKGDTRPIGGPAEEEYSYTLHTIDIAQPTHFYIFSDGFQDQFGGLRKRKFMVKKFRQLLFEIHQKEMEKQRTTLDNTIENWMQEGEEKQIDDILVIGAKLDL